jgi:hypothetical protein
MESSSSSDFSLSVPWRSPDVLVGSEDFLRHPSMDTTERWLRELPVLESNRSRIDGSPRSPHRVKSFENVNDIFESDADEDMPLLKGCRFDGSPKTPHRVKGFEDDDDDNIFESDADEDMPLLKGCRFDGSPKSPRRVKGFEDDDDDNIFESDADEDMPLLKEFRFGKDEKHPMAKLRRWGRGGVIQFRKIDIDSREDSNSQCAHTETTESISSSKSQNTIPKRNDSSKGAVSSQDIKSHRIPTKPRVIMEDESLHEIVERKSS